MNKLFPALPLPAAIALFFAGTTSLRAQKPAASELIWVAPITAADGDSIQGRFAVDQPPPLRGFRANVKGVESSWGSTRPWPYELPAQSAPAEVRAATALVAQRLAKDGLLPTLARVVQTLGQANLNHGEPDDMALLQRVGLPVDLLACYPVPGVGESPAYAVVREVQRRMLIGRGSDVIADKLREIPFRFVKASPTFEVASESGEYKIGMVRMQMPRGDYWRGRGDGSPLDIAAQLVEALPDADLTVAIEVQNVDKFLGLARQWPLRRNRQLTVMPVEWTLSQWAQDNGKPGFIGPEKDGVRTPATLVPRYAGRGDEVLKFSPGESFVMQALAAAGHKVVQSSLLFEGGNVMVVRDPQMGWRRLLVGESEIYRNMALGLSRGDVIEAFKVEFDALECVVLPSVSYHLDYEVSVRAVKDDLVAFVNDSLAASKIILRLAIDAMEEHGEIDAARAKAAREPLESDHRVEVVKQMKDLFASRSAGYGQFPERLSAVFSRGLVDSGVGNLQRVLLALDIYHASLPVDVAKGIDVEASEYLASLRRREQDRQLLKKALEDLRWKVVGVPSLADEGRSINYLNGNQARELFLMPAYGGFLSPLDRAAEGVFHRELGGTAKVVPILCSESQRRSGAIHCSASTYPGR